MGDFIIINSLDLHTNKREYNFSRFISIMGRKQDSSYNQSDSYDFRDHYEETKQKEKPKKETKMKKTKSINKASKQDDQNEQKKSHSHQKHEQKKEKNSIHGDFEQISYFYDNQPSYQNQQINHDRNQQQLNYTSDPTNIYVSGQQIFDNIQMKFMLFFNSIEQPNGFVFKSDFRKKLKKKYQNKINFTDEHQLDPEGKQIQKIKIQVPNNLFIFDKANHNIEMTDEEFTQYIRQDVAKIVEVFQQASYIFCQQVTNELYSILRKLCNIVVEYRRSQEMVLQKLKEFGNKIASQKDNEHKYQFFGFQFEKFPDSMSETMLAELEKKDKYKFALKSKYRHGQQFANFTKDAGVFLQGIIQQLNCYRSLVD